MKLRHIGLGMRVFALLALPAIGTTAAQSVAYADGKGATVTKDVPCAIGTTSTGLIVTFQSHAVVTPSGNSHLVCHGELPTRPPKTTVLKDVPCLVFRPGGGVTLASSSHVVLTKSGRANLTCHFKS